MHIPSLLTHSSRRSSNRGRGTNHHNPHLTLTIPSLSLLFRRPRPPGLEPPEPASHPPTIVREHVDNVPIDSTREQDSALDEELAYQLASEQDLLREQDRLTKLRRRHWHVYGGAEVQGPIPIVISRSRESLVSDADSDLTEYTTSADTSTSYDFDGASPYSTPATANTTASTTSQLSFDVPTWELDVTNSDPDHGHGLPTWVLAPDSNLPGLESYAFSFGVDEIDSEDDYDGSDERREFAGDADMLDAPPSEPVTEPIPSSPFDTSSAALEGDLSSLPPPHASADTISSPCSPPGDSAPPAITNAAGQQLNSRSRSRASSTVSRSSSLKDVPKAENWPF